MSVQAEEGDRDFSCTLTSNRRPQPRHTYRPGCRYYEGRQHVGISQPLGVDGGELEQIVIVGGLHGAIRRQTRGGEAVTASR